MRRFTRLTLAPLPLLAALGLASCSSNSSSTSTTTSSVASTTTTVSQATGPTGSTAGTGPTGGSGGTGSSSGTTGATGVSGTSGSTTTTPSTSTTVGGGGTASCDTSQVSLAPSTATGAAGTEVQRFVVTDTSGTPCSVESYPFVAPYGPMEQDGSSVEADLPITQQPVPASFGDIGGPGGLIDLRPGHSAAFFLVWEDVPTGSGRCPQASGFDFRTPHPRTSDSNKLVKFSFQPCGKSFEVSQMQPPSVKY